MKLRCYTVEKPDGSLDISKAININEQFQVSMQFWSYLVNNNLLRIAQLTEWIPLIMQDRPANEAIAATKIDCGTDINFDALKRMLFDHFKSKNVDINYKHSVDNIKRTSDGSWEMKVKNLDNCSVERHTVKFVFVRGRWQRNASIWYRGC
jgi:malate dehydrogenase (quinone)